MSDIESGLTPEQHGRLSPKERRGMEFTDFLLDILDDRHDIEALLRAKHTLSSRQLRGYVGTLHKTPPFMNGMLPAHAKRPTVSVTVETTSGASTEDVETIILEHEDGAPVTVHVDHGIPVVKYGDSLMLAPADAIAQTLQALLPPRLVHTPTEAQIVDGIAQFSPESTVTYEFTEETPAFRTEVRFIQRETSTDSLHTLEIVHLYDHPSSARLGTRLTLHESVQQRMTQANSDETQHSLDIDALFVHDGAFITVEDIMDYNQKNRTVRVETGTTRHMGDILDALNQLRQA